MFVLALIPLSSILRKTKAAYEYSGSKVKINHLLLMDSLKLYSRSEKELDSLVQTIRIFSKDIEMEFAIEKCVVLVIEEVVKSVGIELPDGKVMKSLQEGVLNRGTLVVIMQILSLVTRKWSSQENKILMECYLLSEPYV